MNAFKYESVEGKRKMAELVKKYGAKSIKIQKSVSRSEPSYPRITNDKVLKDGRKSK